MTEEKKAIGTKKAIVVSLPMSAVIGALIGYLTFEVFSKSVVTSIIIGAIVFFADLLLLAYVLRNAKPIENGGNK